MVRAYGLTFGVPVRITSYSCADGLFCSSSRRR